MSHISVDADGHVIEPNDLWERYLPEAWRARSPRREGKLVLVDGMPANRPDRISHVQGDDGFGGEERYIGAVGRGFDPLSQIEAMDTEGVDISVLFPSIGLMVMGADPADPRLMCEVAAAYNRWLSDFCSDHRDRLVGIAMVDPRDPAEAAAQARVCVEDLGFTGVFLRPNPVGGRQWYDPAYEVLWSTIEELDVPVCFHEGSAVSLPQTGVDRFDRHALWHACSHPMEQQMAMVAMVLGGVLERHPRLRSAFLECGAGWLPYLMWRMDESFEKDGRRDCPDLTLLPSEYVRRQCFVSIDTDEEPGVVAIEHLDGGNVVWGSDYPHPDSKYPKALRTLHSLPGMSEELSSAVLWTNPCELYGQVLEEAGRRLDR